MAETTTTISTDSIPNPDAGKDDKPNKNPIFSLLCSFLQLFKPPLPNKKKIEPTATTSEAKPTQVSGEEEKQNPAVVKFPRQELPSLKLESEGAEPDTNPIVLWQVYAIGGFFILRWAWTRWNERRGNGRPSNDEPPPSQD
ncbi:PREDICTED: uncharacterized protein LOC109232017 [Nicotiana attenuata]|uniref:Uncharacterized protein n=1 Tax=Nicotiana attenuata TaxID=49451 RepID=A0A1J6I1H6_NICAT|nr:PREDICTED: uncharacterized protein LOC109232017 [Nicotiana attenuata]OIS98393.1 hypothetical protein A4A49_00062 [Nicotiana attenuata]